MNEKIILLNNINFSYNNSQIIQNVTLEIRKNDFLALIGPNGGGKSTLLKLIIGFLQSETGSIELYGKPVSENIQKIGYVPQIIQTHNHFPVCVKDVVEMGLVGYFFQSKTEKRNRILQVMEQLGISNVAGNRMDSLSGGQRQRVYVARALVSNPEILLLDEPTSNMDVASQELFYDYLKKINEKITIVIASHDLNVIFNYAKQIACVNRSVCYHPHPALTGDMFKMYYHCSLEALHQLADTEHYHGLKG